MDFDLNKSDTMVNNEMEVKRQIDNINQLAWELFRTDQERSIALNLEARELSEKYNYESGLARSLLGIGSYYSANARYEDSIEYLNAALRKFTFLDDKDGMKSTYITLGKSYNGMEQFAAAIENNSKGLELSIQLNDKNGQILAYNGLGFTYDYLGNKNEALEYFLKGLSLNKDDPYILNNIGCVYSSIGKYEEAIKYTERIIPIVDVDGSLLAAALGNLGEYHGELGYISKAKDYCFEALKKAKECKMKAEEGYALLVIGKIFRKNKEFNGSISYLQDALAIFKEIRTNYDQAETLMNIGKVYIDLDEKDKAISFLRYALKAAEMVSATFFLIDIHLLLAHLYEEIKDLSSAINHYKKHMELSKQMSALELEKKLTSLTIESKIVQATKDAEIHRLKNVELKEKNEELRLTAQALENTLKNLRDAQEQMIQSEKMAALGQLVSGIAHEINSPLGAIQASINNIQVYLEHTIGEKIPELLRYVNESERDMFFDMLNKSIYIRQANSSKDERTYRRALRTELEELRIENSKNAADMIVSMGIYNDYRNYISLLEHPQCQLILQTCYELSDILKNSDNINTAVEKASKIIYALKSYSHFDYSGTAIESDVVKGIETVLNLFNHNIKQGVEIIRNYGLIPPIKCYPDELNQVWTNLISNSLYAMEYKGTIEIETLKEGNYVMVRITDSGAGIPDEIKSRIFEPFFTTKKQGEGTGLGLEIVSKIIAKHHGNIDVESVPGRTSFTVKLPIEQIQ